MDQQNNTIPQSPQGGSVPPPPSPDEQVGVRTMGSDTESMNQSGGGAPQSQVFSASEAVGSNTSGGQQEQNPFASGSPDSGGEFSPGEFFGGGDAPPPVTGGDMNEEPPQKGGSPLKTILIVIGIIIIAAAVGFGVYYLVTSLSSQDRNTEQDLPEPSLPVEATPEATPAPFNEDILETPSPTPIPEPLVHTSLISSPDEQEAIVVESTTRDGFETALAGTVDSPLIFGSVKDLSFQTNSGSFVSSNEFLAAYFPSVASTLSSYLKADFTTWVFGDKTGGNKIGTIFTLKTDVSVDDVKSAMISLEGSQESIASFFLQSLSSSGGAVFEEAPIEGIPVRYLPFSVPNQYVFEYALLASGGERHLVFTTSYRQMVDILDRLSAQDVNTISPQVVEPTPEATPTPPIIEEIGDDTSTSTEE